MAQGNGRFGMLVQMRGRVEESYHIEGDNRNPAGFHIVVLVSGEERFQLGSSEVALSNLIPSETPEGQEVHVALECRLGGAIRRIQTGDGGSKPKQSLKVFAEPAPKIQLFKAELKAL